MFGAVHMAGWNLIFPTVVDRWLWRSASLMCTAGLWIDWFLVIGIPVLPIYGKRTKNVRVALDGIVISIAAIGAVLYMAARVIIMAEMCRCLFYLPPDAFLNTWTASIPHIGEIRIGNSRHTML